MKRSFADDDSGVNITIEYIMHFAILMVLFVVMIFTYQSIMTQSKSVVTFEEMRVISNDIANRIVLFDRAVAAAKAHGGSIDKMSMTFETPAQIAERSYGIEVSDKSVVLSPFDDRTVKISASYTTANKIRQASISSSSRYHTISYDKNTDEIVVT